LATKKNEALSVEAKRRLIDVDHADLSIRRQCELLELRRASYYYHAAPETPENLHLMRLIDEQYLKTPFYGYLRMTAHLRRTALGVKPKRIRRLMRLMGLVALYPKPKTTVANPEHRVYPYLLRGLGIVRPNQVWSADITYLPMAQGCMYLVAVLDWYSRYVLAWQLSNTLDGAFCRVALQDALAQGTPDIFNTDQGSQFTAQAFTTAVEAAGSRMSMDGKGRALENIFIERLWRSVKYEDVYLQDYATVPFLDAGLHHYFTFYNTARPHPHLNYRTPAEVHFNV
jgi:putative transposase